MAADLVIFLDASDNFLLDRVLNLPEELIQDLDYDPQSFQRRLNTFRLKNQAQETTCSFFMEQKTRTLRLGNPGDGT